jgi:hypothetical protein
MAVSLLIIIPYWRGWNSSEKIPLAELKVVIKSKRSILKMLRFFMTDLMSYQMVRIARNLMSNPLLLGEQFVAACG